MKTIPELAEECTKGINALCPYYCFCSDCPESTGCHALVLSIDMIMKGEY